MNYSTIRWHSLILILSDAFVSSAHGQTYFEQLASRSDVVVAVGFDSSADVARIKVPVSKAESLETFSIAFKKTTQKQLLMVLGWGSTRVKVPLEIKENTHLAKL